MNAPSHTDGSRYCARIVSKEEAAAWQEVRRELALFDVDAVRSSLATCPLRSDEPRPGLLFDATDVALIRARADEIARKHVRRECEALMAEPPEHVAAPHAVYLARPARTAADGFLLLQDERMADWARRRMETVMALPTWMGAVHRGLCRRCDHVMANTAAALACARDSLGDALDDGLSDRLDQTTRRLHFEPYLESARRRDDFWSRDEYLANWKIMTHGESGVAICAFADRWPEAREALGLAAEGVVEMLDLVPAEGDWPEGVGYWFAVLFMGLRFARALRRLTGGAVDLFQHPRLDVTGDFATAHISPAGHVYNYGDNPNALTPHCAEALMMLAAERRRPDWLAAARLFPTFSPLWLSLDSAEEPDARPADGARRFEATHVGILRKGATFVGLRSGPATVGHAHLDSNSFVLETRGAPILIDEGNWPYAHFLGFFDRVEGYGGNRWNFDGLATIGHNAVLVDGQGQAYGTAYAGHVEAPVEGDGWMRLDADGSACYPGLLTTWRRSLLLVGEEWLIVRDVIACEGDRHVEWLMHHAAAVADDGNDTILETGDARVRVTPLLPDRGMGWRVSDVTQRSTYKASNTGETQHPAIRYRSFAPLRAAESFEFLFALQLGGADERDCLFEEREGTWRLELRDAACTVRPDGDAMIVE